MSAPRIIPAVKDFRMTEGVFKLPSGANAVKYIKKLIDPDIEGEESYILDVTPSGFELRASSDCGLFRGFQTVKQLVAGSGDGEIACMHIEDSPRFSYRAFMIDSARHMQSVDELKKMISAFSLFKFNVFHWHISDDQGFRFESKKYPRLNEIGSYRDGDRFGSSDSDARYGGFYTREEMREIIDFCSSKYIEVIPEIDMPGHVSAILASYPELSCTGEVNPVRTSGGIFPELLCAGKESVYSFVFGLLDEIAEVFPSEYIHIGGDEAPKPQWYSCPDCLAVIRENGLNNADELQGLFTERVAEYLKSKGKKAIVWNDSLASGRINSDITVQYWMGSEKPAARHAALGGKLIMSDFYHYYLDYPYGMTPLKKTYTYEPVRGGVSPDSVMGVSVPIWTEYVRDAAMMQYLCFPRAAAAAETAWSDKKNKCYPSFKKKMKELLPLLSAVGIVPAPVKKWDMGALGRAADLNRFRKISFDPESAKRLAKTKKEERKIAEKMGFKK